MLYRKDFKSDAQLIVHLGTKNHRKKEAEVPKKLPVAKSQNSTVNVDLLTENGGSSIPIQVSLKSKKALKKKNKKLLGKIRAETNSESDEEDDDVDPEEGAEVGGRVANLSSPAVSKVQSVNDAAARHNDLVTRNSSSSSSDDSDEDGDEQLLSVFAASKINRA